MKKWLNALRYGEKGIAFYIFVVILLFVAVGILFGSAIASGSIWKGITASLLLAVNIYLLKNLSEEELHKKDVKNTSKEKTETKELENLPQEEKKENIEEEKSYENYNTKQKLEYVLISYKVKKEKKTVIIDFCEEYKIKQCPAYIWREKNKLCFLLLENKPRNIEIPLNELKGITYEKGVVAMPSLEYVSLKKSPLMNSVFSPFLPSYYQETRNGITVSRKNLYVLSPDIKFTNNSIRAVFDLLSFDFEVNDNCTNSNRFNDYFKMIYKQNILLKDHVLEREEFYQKIKELLKNMAEADIHDDVFEETLVSLISHRLIPQEYGEFFQKYRQKINLKKK